jgi:hypothetical protein
MDGEYEALVNYTDREIQKHSDGQIDRQTETRPIPTCSATSLTLMTYGLRGESRGLPPEPWHGQGTKGFAEEVPHCVFKHHFTKTRGGV